MAGPITHFVFAYMALPLLLASGVNEEEFINGTIFPDSRYTTQVPRNKSHIEPVSWQDVVNWCEKDPHYAGMLFHNVVDLWRLRCFEHRFYDRHYEKDYVVTDLPFPALMKIAEDHLMYQAYLSHAHQTRTALSTICENERTLCNDDSAINKWHTLVQTYCTQGPSVTSLNEMCKNSSGKIPFSGPEYDAAQINLKKILNNTVFVKQWKNFCNSFITLLTNNKDMTLELDPELFPNDK
jgi:hypothetical protein